jgi:hypothetical protein
MRTVSSTTSNSSGLSWKMRKMRDQSSVDDRRVETVTSVNSPPSGPDRCF